MFAKQKSKCTIVIGVMGTIFAATAVADSAPTIYGKINVTLNKYEFERPDTSQPAPYPKYTAQDNWELESNASRIGIKGDYAMGEGIKAIYKLEYELYTDGSTSSTSSTSFNVFRQRNTYAGVQGGLGTLFAGRSDTPTKTISASTVQLFKDLPLTDYKYFLVGENRENNIVQYTTPTVSGFAVTALVEAGEDSGASNISSSHTNDGLFDKYSLAATYQMKNVYLAIANDHNIQNTNIWRGVGSFNWNAFMVGVLVQKAERNFNTTSTGAIASLGTVGGLPVNNNSSSNGNPITDFTAAYDKQDAYALSGSWKLDAHWILKAQYGASKSNAVAANIGDTKATNYAMGVDYQFNSNATVFAYYAALDTRGDSDISSSLKDKTFAVGYDFKF